MNFDEYNTTGHLAAARRHLLRLAHLRRLYQIGASH
jgi:hypothetical protein